ncbi:MAG: LuxR C-terminal-related transcriptional regulator, partial [Bacteroidales bacterium]|nr:LuxR C-terminal-related transcriptional regulator [Bacteroidales bacterium]
IADVIHMKILFASKRSRQMIGIEPEDVSFYHFMEATHPDDLQRLNIGRSKIVKAAQDIFIAKKGSLLLATNFRIRNAGGEYPNILTQNYLFYSTTPYKTVFLLKVHTNIDWSKKIKCGYHYYIGDDMSYFRYPDDEMLKMGNVFSKREFEIIKLIETGLSTEQIAEKLFLSVYTVNSHRRNILEKTGKAHISELIYELVERGLL